MNATSLPNLSNLERTALVVWSLSVSLVSVTGNIIVLVSSLKYKAIHLDKVSMVLIRNLCAADLSYVIYILLTVGNIVRGEYLYGDFLCYWSYCFALSLTATEMGLICGLNVSKLITLHNPLRARQRKTNTGRMIAAVVWILSFGWSLTVRVYNYRTGEITAYFNASSFQCFPIIHTELAGALVKVSGVIYNLLPTLVLLVSTTWLFCFVNKTTGVHKHTVLTLALVSGVFLLAYGPYSAAVLLYSRLQDNPRFITYFRVAVFSPYLNYAANPIIYFLTLRSFREFVQKKMIRLLPSSKRRHTRVVPITSSTSGSNKETSALFR
jgi:hypothetical protein